MYRATTSPVFTTGAPIPKGIVAQTEQVVPQTEASIKPTELISTQMGATGMPTESATPTTATMMDEMAMQEVMIDPTEQMTPTLPARLTEQITPKLKEAAVPTEQSATPRIYIIVVTYNGRRWLDKCLGTLHDPSARLNVVVVDNDSSDGTQDIIRNTWPDVKLIEAGENLGFGKANNIGIKYALDSGCDCVYLLNQDAWIEPDDILRLAELQSQNPQYGVLSPMQMQADMTTPDHNFDLCCNEPNCAGYRHDVGGGIPLRDVYEVQKVMAAHWLVSAESINLIGGFAPIFRHYGEDYNFLDRLSYHGLKTGICPDVKAVHDRGSRTDEPLKNAMTRVYNSVYLPLACDITKSSFNAFQHALRAITKKSLQQVSKYRSFKPLLNPAKAISYIGKIKAMRKETKIAGIHYL